MSKYVIRAADKDTYAFRGPTADAVTEELDLASGFSSRLAAETLMETLKIDPCEWIVARRDSIERRAKKFEPPFELHITDPLAAVQRTCELHYEYCDRIEAWLSKAGVKRRRADRPVPCMTITSPTWAGMYSTATHVCHYPVVYAMMAADWDKTVVAHEVVHAYQRDFTGHQPGHGPDFYALMEHAMGSKIAGHHHRYSVTEARRLSEHLRPWWDIARGQGLLQSLPCEVLITKTKRKGVR